ncbi:DUF3558 domain-containing protein [Actinomycetospora termitidis]|uniref:DUF3558 domain-containing protein n=1 Tax=Actinomycetospora termitidis TaxID=3053470 RepID=A0ABT7MIW7_9PSEU|nr:DUF3558 domain-containing protein [Actinomycetospora sp. Odt1-22]MDL5159283.1 DUF3558 domain-containing protein [Actinomycetospora sp. Odt1-22]
MGVWRSATLVLVAALAGCAGPVAPPPFAPPISERYGAPAVERPLDVTAIFADACSQLTNAELEQLTISSEGKHRSFLGDSQCRWTSRNDDILAMSIYRDRDLLVDAYRSRLLPVFQPTTVAGYPAVREATSPQNNNCVVTVGLGPEQALRSDWTGLGAFRPGDPDPCERAESAAAFVVRKLSPR